MTQALQTAVRSLRANVDYDVHGLVGIRLVDPSLRDVAAVSGQIGNMQGTLSRDPDITIRFVDEVPSGALSWIEPHEVGFSDDGFFLFAPGSGQKPAARLALDAVDRPYEILCRTGLAAVPLLRPLVDLSMLAKGVIALHASAFTHNGTGVLVAGWARGGKTTSLLAFMARGAAFIGDDRVYLNPAGNRLYGLAQPVGLRAWHLAELPRYGELVRWRERSRLRFSSALGRLATSVSAADRIGATHGLARRVASFADDASVAIAPDRLFGSYPLTGKLDRAFLAIAHQGADVRVEPIEPERLADRLVFSLGAERLPMLAHYLRYRFAFPERSSALIERANEIERKILLEAFAESETYALYHPFPAPVRALYDAMAPIVG
ncbi:MAG TPA: hypothetical protein VK488_11305 [Gaiellaceae bacterium]|nr:hypothetical protein [Gaiellaceae bacterium]